MIGIYLFNYYKTVLKNNQIKLYLKLIKKEQDIEIWNLKKAIYSSSRLIKQTLNSNIILSRTVKLLTVEGNRMDISDATYIA